MTVEGGLVRLSRSDPQTRRVGATVAWTIVGLTGLVWFGSIRIGAGVGSVVALALTLLLGFWAAWVTWSHREWQVRHGQITSHRRFAGWRRERMFQSGRLEVERSTDSDNDDHYHLRVLDAQGKRTIASEIHDDADIVDLGKWLSALTGFPLTLPHAFRSRP
jgi:hypothetical protein